MDRVVDDVLEERRQDFGNAFRCLIAGSRYVELQRQGEDETDHDGKESRQKSTDEIQDDDIFDVRFVVFLFAAQGSGDQDEDQYRGDALQGPDEDDAEQGQFLPRCGESHSHGDTDDQADDDLLDQADAVQCIP